MARDDTTAQDPEEAAVGDAPPPRKRRQPNPPEEPEQHGGDAAPGDQPSRRPVAAVGRTAAADLAAGPAPKAATIDLEERLDKVEDLLVAGIGPGRIERLVAKDYGVSQRQARRYIAKVYDRWRKQTIEDAPHRREKLIRMVERFYAKCFSEKQYSAASNALVLLGRMSGAFAQHDPAREERLSALGPPPTDPTQALVWAQRCMALGLYEVITNPALDPERRLRWIAELGGKLGITHAKTIVEAKLDAVEARVLGAGERHEEDLESTAGLAFPPTSRARRRDP